MTGPSKPLTPTETFREDVKLLANAILGGTNFKPHREAAERALLSLDATQAVEPLTGMSNITTMVGDDAGALGHSHLWFCQCSDESIPRHVCAAARSSSAPAELDVEALAEAMWFEGLIDDHGPEGAAAKEAAASLEGAYRGMLKHRAARLTSSPENPA